MLVNPPNCWGKSFNTHIDNKVYLKKSMSGWKNRGKSDMFEPKLGIKAQLIKTLGAPNLKNNVGIV